MSGLWTLAHNIKIRTTMEEKEKIKIYTLFTIQVVYDEDANNGNGSFGFYVYESIMKSRWWWFDKTIKPANLIHMNLSEIDLVQLLNKTKNYKLKFEKIYTSETSFRTLDMYYEDVVFDVLTKLN